MPATIFTSFTDDPHSDVRGVTYRADTYCVSCGVLAYLRHEGTYGHGLSYVAQEALDLLGRWSSKIRRPIIASREEN